MKQHTTISTSIALSRAAATSLSAEQHLVAFPDTAPPSPTKLEEWGRAVGMEAFIDSSGKSPATTTIMMAGKVLVLDVDIDGGVVVKASFAVGNHNANGPPAAPDLDAFLARDIARWVDAANRASLAAAHRAQAEDPAVEAAYLGLVVQDHLRYLMMLDSLAVAEGERGIRWFMEPVSAAQHFLDVQKSIGSPQPSIDIPIPHLTMSLLAKYDGATIARLKLVPSSEGVGVSPQSNPPNDHTFPQVPSHSWVLEFNRPSRLRHQPANCGIVVSQSRLRTIQAVLAMDLSTDVLMNMSVPTGSTTAAGLGNLGPFGPIGPVTGMNMGNLAFNGFMISPSHAQSIDNGSWVDLLLNNGAPAEYYKAAYNSPSQAHPPLSLRLTAPQEPGFLLQEVPVKTASEVSHILDIVREQCWLNELLGMLQWQPDNAALSQKDPTSVLPATGPEVEESVSLELLASVLAGAVTPHSIPVSVYLPSAMLPPLMGSNASHFGLEGLGVGPPPITGGSSAASLFGSTDMEMEMEIPGLSMSMNSGMDMSMVEMGMELSNSPVPSRPPPMIVLSSPARAPAAGMVELRASFGEFGDNKVGSSGSECGVEVEASAGVDTRGMDEVIRRGGIWGLPGRVWVNMGPK
ncbi:hypothetical protein JVT61DRAFT_2985 [Boletus reticuloceps]|uniref:Mediator of RNA polymerase II transcription subunit 1 n=1 Tax=Boletus reticuloceps TaxID=495285 RepID=A0A8I3A854_9AGAM|nr:hypothetical protein JVT61DRAFT_2985 [Boletus reticuloceps]